MLSNRIPEALLREETSKLNLHLPKERKTLEELVREETPSVRARDGSEIILDRKMLEKLEKQTPPSVRGSIRLPIIVLRRLDLGKSVFTVLGDSVDQSTVRNILGLTDEPETTYLYWPHVAQLVREFHSLVVIGFATSDKHSPSLGGRK